MPPLISICLPNLNTRPFLQERMDSILAQTVTDWELIICDSYSDDGSWEFFQRFKGDPRIRLFQVPRDGLYAGWNECLRRTCGEYIYIATSDDTMTCDCLEKLAAPFARWPDIKLTLCDFQDINEESEPIFREPRPQCVFLGEWMRTPCIRNGKTEFLLHCAFGTTVWVTMTALMIRRNLLDQIGYFQTDLGSRADEEWTLRAALASDIVYVPERLATWRNHPMQATRLWKDVRQAEHFLCQCLASVVRDPNSGIPDSWKEVEGWAKALSLHQRQKYEQTFKLYRWFARSDPKTFMRDIWQAMHLAPRWFWHQAWRGFPALDNEEFDSARHALNLINLFKADWPPQRLGSRC